MSNYFIVVEFWGKGDPMFGGGADDRVLGKAGSYLPRCNAPEDVAFFDTREEAEEAMAKTPKARIDGKPSIIPWTHQVRSGCGKNLEPGMLVSVGKAFRYNGKRGGTYEPDELTGRKFYVTRLCRPGGRPDVATDVMLVAAEGCTPEMARQLADDGDVWVVGHRLQVEDPNHHDESYCAKGDCHLKGPRPDCCPCKCHVPGPGYIPLYGGG